MLPVFKIVLYCLKIAICNLGYPKRVYHALILYWHCGQANNHVASAYKTFLTGYDVYIFYGFVCTHKLIVEKRLNTPK